jgi:diamine N-acetyltransferase
MIVDIAYLKTLFAYDDWANRESLASLRRVDSPPPRALEVMGHIVGCEWLWIGRLKQNKDPAAVWPGLSLDECSVQLCDLTEAWGKYLSILAPCALYGQIAYTNSKRENWISSVQDILTHVIIHSGYHRGQIAMLLGRAGHEPAYTDFIHYIRQRCAQPGSQLRLSSSDTSMLPSEAPAKPMKSVRLHPTTQDDIEFVVDAERNPDNAPFILPWTRAQHVQALTDPDLAHLIIEPCNKHEPVGFVLLAGLTNPHGSLEFRRIVVTSKGQGFGRAAVRAVKQFAFSAQKAHRLWLDVKEHNTRARRLYESERFVSEGIRRECLRTDSGFDSLVVMSMLASEASREE